MLSTIMFRPNRISYIFTAITIVLASLLQFHHHDCNGSISIHITTLDDITLGSNISLLNICIHKENHRHQTDCNSVDDCAMHLAISKSIKQDQHSQIVQTPSFDLSYILANIIECQHPIYETDTTYNNDLCALLYYVLFPLKALRAPPFSNNHIQ